MKQLLPIILVTSLSLACSTGNEKEKTTPTAPVAEIQTDHTENTTGLALNKNKKWKADSTTLLNVKILQKVISVAKNESLENYIKTGEGLQDGLNKMILECKMKGADHEALHQWLEPLMEKTKALKTVTTIENAQQILSEIEKQINLFSQYFEI